MSVRVNRGRYAGREVYRDSKHKVLYVKNGNRRIELTSDNVASWNKIHDTTYGIEWEDGSKSIIKVPISWAVDLELGCDGGYEVANSGKGLKGKVGPVTSAIIWAIIGFVVLAVFISWQDPNPPTTSETITPSEWASWDGTAENMPYTKVPVYVSEALGNTRYDYGNIKGILRNRTSKPFSYVQVSFGLYDSNGNKIASCFTNMNQLGPGEDWKFDAYCSSWTEGAAYRLENVTYF